MDERWQQIERIYHAARELEGSARAEYLARACAGDEELCREVESLLEHQAQAGSFLEKHPVEMVAKVFGKDQHLLRAPNAAFGPGSMIAHYRLTGKIGEGGMGEVYRARDTKLQRDVALKILPMAMAQDAQRMARFEREAQVLASLNHPNIAAIHGLEESNGIRALVMELVEGETLAERLGRTKPSGREPSPQGRGWSSGAGPGEGSRGSALATGDALPIARQIAEALEYAHERGVIHRDLKPTNVKITPEGTVKVLDFGLAKVMNPMDSSVGSDAVTPPTLSSLATEAGMLLGTAAYMSPEQAKGQRVDRRCDIWAFGCVLFEMLSGRKAFAGETTSDVLAAVIKSDPDWDAWPETTPPPIQKLVRRCLQKDQHQRLQAIGDARITIEEMLSGDVGERSALPRDDEALPYVHPQVLPLRRALLWLLAGLLLGALVSTYVIWKFAAQAVPQAPLRFSAVTNFAGVQADPALSPDGRSVAFVSNRDGPYDIYVGLVSGGNLVKLTDDPNYKARPSWSRDGTQIAYARLNQSGIWDIWEVPALGGTPRRLILNAIDPAWSPDGQTLAYENSVTGALCLSDLSSQNSRVVATTEDPRHRYAQPRFSPDGRKLAFVDRGPGPYGDLDVADLASGELLQLTPGDELLLSPAWSPDGRSIYFTSGRGGTMNVWKIPAAGGKQQQITIGQGDDAELDVSPDGKRIVFSTFRERTSIAQMDLETGPGQPKLKQLTTDPARSQLAPAYSPDGKHLAYCSGLWGIEGEGIWFANADGSNPVELVQDKRFTNIFPHWTPDGNSLVYLSFLPRGHEYRRISIPGGAPQTLVKDADDMWNDVNDWWFDVGPDGRLIYQGGKGQVMAFDPENNKTVTLGTLPASQKFGELRWAPGGRSVAYKVSPGRENDPNAGLWVSEFKNPPRQVFRGWVVWYVPGSHGEIFLLEGKPDLNGVLWKVGWDGKGLTRIARPVPLTHSDWVQPGQNPQDFFDVSPDGRHLALTTQSVLQANIGMIENFR